MKKLSHPTPKRAAGFTLIELMVATAISAILASIAYPSFQGVVLKARRIDALTALMQVHATQERWRSNAAAYATLDDLRVSGTSPMGHYRIDIAEAQATGFVATATATGLQAADADCRVMRLSIEDGNLRHASGSDTGAANPSALNKRCWNL